MSNQPKIWLITRRMGDNFGSSLQAYALQQTLIKQGFNNCEIIRYDEYSVRWKLRPFVYDCIYLAMRILKPLSSRLMPTKYKWFVDRDIQHRRFVEFEKKHLKLTTNKYANGDSKAIAKEINNDDICVCGSDQIWSPLLFDPVMFMNFCRGKSTKTIAYAPSIGVSEVHAHREEMAELIANIKHLSVREVRGAEIINELTGLKAEVVADPTLLLLKTDWEKIVVTSKIERPYILCYFLGNEPLPEKLVYEIEQKTGYELYVVYSYFYPTRINGKHLSTLSPEEFLGYIANAEYVCTNSFHGTIFSILFERQFFCFEKKTDDKINNTNSRVRTLLKQTGLESRLLKVDECLLELEKPIDYNKVDTLIDAFRLKSLSYLSTLQEK